MAISAGYVTNLALSHDNQRFIKMLRMRKFKAGMLDQLGCVALRYARFQTIWPSVEGELKWRMVGAEIVNISKLCGFMTFLDFAVTGHALLVIFAYQAFFAAVILMATGAAHIFKYLRLQLRVVNMVLY